MRPLPPPAEPDAALDARLARWLRLAWAAMLWERLWPLALPPLSLAGLFVAAALFDILPRLAGWLHALVLAGLAGGLGYLVVRAWSRLHPPRRDEAARRLERDSGLAHRPLEALADRPAGPGTDPVAEALWQAHRRRMAALVGNLRVALPHPNMAARDPWALRAAVLLLLVIAATVGGRDAGPRLARALSPAVGSAGLAADALEVWITPPAYTGIAPILLQRGQPASHQPLTIPAGSMAMAVLSGGWGRAHLAVDGADTPFQRQGDDSQRVETQIQAGSRLAVRQAGFTVGTWPIRVVADAVPSIAFAAIPEAGERGRLRLALSASDDYGLAKAWVNVRRLDAQPEDEALVVELALPGGRPRAADLAGWHDLTAHPWAGLPATLQPAAQDAIGQVGTGEAVTVTLPERSFLDPVAAAVVAQRRRLTESRDNAPEAAGLLDRVTGEPELIKNDLKTFLMLRTARKALGTPAFDLGEVQELMWHAALRIEEGDLAAAERALEEARRALEQAIDENAPAEELQRLLDQFQQALQRAIDAMAERMAANGQAQPLPNADGHAISDEELQQMVEGMRDMAESGARDALRQMLQNMAQIMDGLRAGMQQPVNGASAQAIQQLRELARRQQAMLDQSHRRAQEEGGEAQSGQGGQPQAGRPGEQGQSTQAGRGGEKGGAGRSGSGGSGAGAQAAQAQEALRRTLGEVSRALGQGLGEAPRALGEAERAMGDAAGDLGRGQWADAAEAQGQALRLMQQATREALEQMGSAGQGTTGLVPRDPLGRPARGAGIGDDGTTRVPDRSEVQRSRDILNELRRRAGEFQRPEPERDYLRRLLKQF